MPPVSSRPIFIAPISRLPSSLLSYILSHLDHTTLITLHRVCHIWHTTCDNPLTWIHTHLALYARACDDVWLYRMMQAQTQRTIHLPVRHLTLCTTTVTSRTISSLSALIGSSLHSLTLDTITLQHPRRPTVPSITSMISCGLHTLTITWEMISIVNLIAIGQMSTLRVLNMTWKMPVFNSRGLEPRHFEPLQQLKELTSLSITCAPSFNTSTPIDEFLIATLSPTASLTTLSLHGHHFTARVMQHITTTCTHLHELNLANTGFWNLPTSIRNTSYELAPYLSLSSLKQLQSLQLSASALCNDGMMAAMELDTCTSLIRLSCAAPMAICRRPMTGSFLSSWSHSSSLHELALPHAQLTDTTITSLVQHCPKLQSLSLAYNMTMTNDAMDILAQLQHLTHINLRHTMIDDDGLIRFATSTCATMISIDIRGCDGITVDGIVHVQNLLLCDVIHDMYAEEESISHHPHFHRPSVSHSCSEQSETSQVQWMEMRNVVDAK